MHKVGTRTRLLLGVILLIVIGVGCIDRREPLNTTQSVQHIPNLKHRLNATFVAGRQPTALLYGIHTSPRVLKRGQQAKITFYYKALRSSGSGWALFLHAQTTRGRAAFTNLDRDINQAFPAVQQWKPGKLYRSTLRFTVPRNATGNILHLYMGIWHQRQGRMSIKGARTDGNNRLLLASLALSGKGPRKLPPRPIYVAHRTDTPPVIDGKLDDPIWKKTRSTGAWHYYNYQKKPHFRTEAKITWDKQYLYIGVDCQDDDIWSTYTQRDQPLFKQEVVEFFVDANRDKKDYAELQVSPAGVIFDTFFTRHRYPRPWGQLRYDSGLLTRVHVRGTLNNKRDKDRGWSVEMRFPLKRLVHTQRNVRIPPQDGDEWLINFYRLERSRRSRVYEDHAWSPPFAQRSGDYHTLHRFGTLRFSTQKAGTVTGKQLPTLRPAVRVVKRTAPPVRRKPKLFLRNDYHKPTALHGKVIKPKVIGQKVPHKVFPTLHKNNARLAYPHTITPRSKAKVNAKAPQKRVVQAVKAAPKVVKSAPKKVQPKVPTSRPAPSTRPAHK